MLIVALTNIPVPREPRLFRVMRVLSFSFALLLFASPGGVPAQAPARVEAVPARPVTAVKRKPKYTVRVDAAQGWLDTGVPLLAGDRIDFAATGEIKLTSGQTVTADGMDHLWRDLLRQYPLPTAKTGALIGRVGSNPAAVPFVIGSEGTWTVRGSGNLFVRANVSDEIAGEGDVNLTVTIAPSANTPGAPAAAPALATVLQPKRFDALPRRDDDGQGNAGDAINFALVGTEQQVREGFVRSGWFAVDADRNTAILHGLLATLAREPYREVPMSTLFLFGRPQDMSFARGDTVRVAAERHHLRLWKTTETVGGKPLWVGSATFDNGFERDTRNGALTHSIAPAIDEERDFLRDSFDSSGSYSSAAYVTPLDPVKEARTATGASFHTDGRILVMDLD